MEVTAGYIMLIAAGLIITSYTFFAFWQHLAENIILDLRKKYIAALMNQEIAYFEINKVEQIPSQIAEMFDTCKSSIGEKIANLIFACATCTFGILYALIYGPLYAFICICYLPVLIGILAVFGRMVQKSTL
jgi:ABC-type bacteriocin/lantibiotic exporter with double-glycine peptidase domain